jgi:hypothetical protein
MSSIPLNGSAIDSVFSQDHIVLKGSFGFKALKPIGIFLYKPFHFGFDTANSSYGQRDKPQTSRGRAMSGSSM